jgi:hypothetical protein
VVTIYAIRDSAAVGDAPKKKVQGDQSSRRRG